MRKLLQRLSEASDEYVINRFTPPVSAADKLRGEIPKEIVLYAKIATVQGYRVAYLSKNSFARYAKDDAYEYYALKLDGTPDPDRVATKNPRGQGWRVDGTTVRSKKMALAYLSYKD
jgi:hypothetical protein